MIRYLVREESKATADNPNFAGQEMTAYYGKKGIPLARYGSHAKAMHGEMDFDNWMIAEYGYKRKCDAKRSWVYKNPENSKYWASNTTIIEAVISLKGE